MVAWPIRTEDDTYRVDPEDKSVATDYVQSFAELGVCRIDNPSADFESQRVEPLQVKW